MEVVIHHFMIDLVRVEAIAIEQRVDVNPFHGSEGREQLAVVEVGGC